MRDDKLDALAVISFLVGMANYNENLTQNDKDDLLRRLEQQTNDIVERIETDLDTQNKMLSRIIELLERRN